MANLRKILAIKFFLISHQIHTGSATRFVRAVLIHAFANLYEIELPF